MPHAEEQLAYASYSGQQKFYASKNKAESRLIGEDTLVSNTSSYDDGDLIWKTLLISHIERTLFGLFDKLIVPFEVGRNHSSTIFQGSAVLEAALMIAVKIVDDWRHNSTKLRGSVALVEPWVLIVPIEDIHFCSFRDIAIGVNHATVRLKHYDKNVSQVVLATELARSSRLPA